MKVFFDKRFLQTYTGDPAATSGRLDHAYLMVKERYSLVAPAPCSREDVLLVHDSCHLELSGRPEKRTHLLLK
ncbi:hypothetical protein KO465_04525 [Candidatus Micrarchaeota archaeon]|nr:hypothetical protein [Candidatus Micrarchaeota archaeon]